MEMQKFIKKNQTVKISIALVLENLEFNFKIFHILDNNILMQILLYKISLNYLDFGQRTCRMVNL